MALAHYNGISSIFESFDCLEQIQDDVKNKHRYSFLKRISLNH